MISIVVALPLIEVDDRRARAEVVAGVLAGDRVDRVRPQLAAPRRLGHRLANLLAHPDLVGADRRLHLEGRHAGVLADRAFVVDGQVDVLRDDRQRLRRRASPAGSAPSACFIAARTSGGRSVEVRTMSWRTLSKNDGSIVGQYNSAIAGREGLSTIDPMTFRTERDPLGELQRPRRRVLRRPDRARRRELSDQRPSRARRSRHRHHPHQESRGRGQRARSAASTPTSADAIVARRRRDPAGALRDQFVVDVYQAGAGTSHNMNANEVLANRAGETPRRAARHLHARAPERSRQHGAVDQRRVPDGDAAGAAARRTRRSSPRRAALAGSARRTRPTSSPTC